VYFGSAGRRDASRPWNKDRSLPPDDVPMSDAPAGIFPVAQTRVTPAWTIPAWAPPPVAAPAFGRSGGSWKTAARAGAVRVLRRLPWVLAALRTAADLSAGSRYRRWIAEHDTLNAADRAAIATRVAALPERRFSLVLPVGDAPPSSFAVSLAALRAQFYPHWDLCVAAPAARAERWRALVDQAAGGDARILPLVTADSDDLGAAFNAALLRAGGDFVGILRPGDLLAPHALYELAEEIAANPDAALLYSDEDALDGRGRRCAPQFKTDWNHDLLLGQDAVGSLAVYRRRLLDALGGMRRGFGAAAPHDLALRIAEASPPERIGHIPAVLYHARRARPAAADAAASRRAITAHLARVERGEARVVPHPALPQFSRVERSLPSPAPLVSVVILTRDRPDMLARSADGLLRRTDYPNFELIIVDNGSVQPATRSLLERLARDPRVVVTRDNRAFNYGALNNRAARLAQGDVLLMLNNDVDMITPGWLAELVAQVSRPGVAMAGPKLLYPGGFTQNAGLVLGVSGVADDAEHLSWRGSPGYLGRLQLAREVSALTGACLAVRREVFEAVGGFDELHLAVAFNDVDLCLRVREHGWRVVWTPFAELYHWESATRGPDDTPASRPRFAAERAYMRRRWGPVLDADPFYSPNVSLRDGRYRPGPPRRIKPWRRAAQPHRHGLAAFAAPDEMPTPDEVSTDA
jgi:O-antigen biosynthesis protein